MIAIVETVTICLDRLADIRFVEHGFVPILHAYHHVNQRNAAPKVGVRLIFVNEGMLTPIVGHYRNPPLYEGQDQRSHGSGEVDPGEQDYESV